MQLKYQENYATLKCTVVQLSMKLAIDTVKIDEKGLKLPCLLGLKNSKKRKVLLVPGIRNQRQTKLLNYSVNAT
jgi:hypothetical protein